MTERKIRRAQTLTPFGVGAIFDFVGESFVAEDTQRWYGRPQNIRAPRIASLYGVSELRTAPAAPEWGGIQDGPGVPFFRFPQWLFCPNCRRMVRWSFRKESPGQAPRCEECRGGRQLVPMRFVMICGNGHLDDVDWDYWTHSESNSREQRQCRLASLRFNVIKGVGGGLQSLETKCTTCRASRTLRGIASPGIARQIGLKCRGRQPWLPSGDSEECDLPPVIVQRGASNVYFPHVASALDIPPESDYDHFGLEAHRIRSNPNFELLEKQPDHPMADGLVSLIASKEGCPEDTVRRALNEQLGGAPNGPGYGVDDSEEQVRRDEWHAFTIARDRLPDPRDNFVIQARDISRRTRPGATGPAADELSAMVSHLILAHRLREIRVLTSFSRYDMQRSVKPDLGAGLNWLPAIEVFGEGTFFSLDESRLRAWEVRDEVRERIDPLQRRLGGSMWSRFLPRVTPRFVLLHTLSHILIRRFVYETGYSSASLRERLYVGNADSGAPMSGILIYTGAGDSEGTLGGLVRSGEPNWFIPTFLSALQEAAWCSLDPVCGESTGQGPDSLSLACCHACGLVSETSCDHANSLLDRRLLVDPELGFFGSVLVEMTNESAARVF